MKRKLLLILLFVGAVIFAGDRKSVQDEYIAKYSGIAVSEMYRTGVPASITLAQGLLESGAGLSSLATKGHNHFGIKCHRGWTGGKMYADDDKAGECFRTYATDEESFRDHSDFLRYYDRYKFLFDFETTDYTSWAYGLKKAGYATDPGYPAKLIKIIEDYKLSAYDRMSIADAVAEGGGETIEPSVAPDSKKHARAHKRSKKARSTDYVDEELANTIPESPLRIEEPKAVPQGEMEQYHFSLSRQLYSRNGVPFIYSVEGESYASIADYYNLFLSEIVRYNDLDFERKLLPGTIVYLQPKKKEAAKGLEKYIVGGPDEDFREICQRFGVKMSSVRKMNGLPADYVPREGDELALRKSAVRKK
ncbi:MAG: glucosaminidase domain-containing protein [Bacteroidales bacterium]|nr:glucosaminidase domain-containing protein [Bacteroidales bacterium]